MRATNRYPRTTDPFRLRTTLTIPWWHVSESLRDQLLKSGLAKQLKAQAPPAPQAKPRQNFKSGPPRQQPPRPQAPDATALSHIPHPADRAQLTETTD